MLVVIFGPRIGRVAGFFCQVVLATPILVVACYGRGDVRTAAIGALVPCFFFWDHVPTWMAPTGRAVLFVMAVVFSASLAVLTRRWLERRGLTAQQ
jgi:hypothetical protein